MRILDILAVFGLIQMGQAHTPDADYKEIMRLLNHPAAPPVLEENKEFCYATEMFDWDVWRKCFD